MKPKVTRTGRPIGGPNRPMMPPYPKGSTKPPLPGFKKGGSVKASDIMGTGPSPAAAKADYAKKMKAAGLKPKASASKKAKGGMAKAPKGGMGIMIILGKKGK